MKLEQLYEINPYGLHIKVYKDEADYLIKIANSIYFKEHEKD